MIAEMKTLLKNVITKEVPQVKNIFTTSHEVTQMRSVRGYTKAPCVSLITNQGTFDDRVNAWEKRFNTETNTFETRYKRGIRRVPLTLSVYALDEQTADTVASAIFAHIPRTWVYNDYKGYITVGVEQHSDRDPAILGGYQSDISILFEGIAAGVWQTLPTATKQETKSNIKT